MLTINRMVQMTNCDYSDRHAVMVMLRNSFSDGIGSILSQNGDYSEMSIGSLETDAEKTRGDWDAVGREMWAAYKIERGIQECE